MNDKQICNFVTSHSMNGHPLTRSKKKTKIRYYYILDYFVKQCVSDTEYVNVRLLQYQTMLIGEETTIALNDNNRDRVIYSIINDRFRPWMWKYRFYLMCDIALISMKKSEIENALRFMSRYLNQRQYTLLDVLVTILFADDTIPQELIFTKNQIEQFRMNWKFVKQPDMRILITANMSAGKSTLINAIIGKPVTRTSQEACTSNLCYLFNKAFEDNSVHLLASPLNLNASYCDLMSIERANISYISTYFRALVKPKARVCFIDTPGVNSAINKDHGKLTNKALVDEKYDKLVYVLNANKLGTDEEIRYLKYISENVPRDKVIFVLNKLDDFKSIDDSIKASIEGVRKDLLQLGYENPVICPLSAYFALLLKIRQSGETLTEDEQDAYDLYVKKFSKAEYDLSSYLDGVTVPAQFPEDDMSGLALKCGIYGLEKVLYGGVEK